jgi:ribosomal protein L7/L12
MKLSITKNEVEDLVKKHISPLIDAVEIVDNLNGMTIGNLNEMTIGILRTEGKLAAVKYVRTIIGCGLKEGKDFVENLEK